MAQPLLGVREGVLAGYENFPNIWSKLPKSWGNVIDAEWSPVTKALPKAARVGASGLSRVLPFLDLLRSTEAGTGEDELLAEMQRKQAPQGDLAALLNQPQSTRAPSPIEQLMMEIPSRQAPPVAKPGSLPPQVKGPGFNAIDRAKNASFYPTPTGAPIAPDALVNEANQMAAGITKWGPKSGVKESVGRERKTGERHTTQKNLWAGEDEARAIADMVNSLPWIQEQRAGQQQLRDMLNMQAQASRFSPIDAIAKPLAALADSQTGSRILAGLPAEAPQGKAREMMLNYAEKLQDNQRDLTAKALEAVTKLKTGTQTDSRTNDLLEKILISSGNFSGKNAAGDDKLNRTVERFEKNLGSQVPTVLRNLEEMDSLVGGIDNVTAKSSIPGVGPGMKYAPDFLLSDKASRIRQLALNLYRAKVYMDSGKQINEQEARDELKALGMGWDSKESSFRQGLKGLKDSVLSIIKHKKGAYPKEAINLYNQRLAEEGSPTLDEQINAFNTPRKKPGEAPGPAAKGVSKADLLEEIRKLESKR